MRDTVIRTAFGVVILSMLTAIYKRVDDAAMTQEILGDVIVEVRSPLDGGMIHHRIVRLREHKDARVWAAYVVSETLQFQLGLEGK
jgi:hypothetical protein